MRLEALWTDLGDAMALLGVAWTPLVEASQPWLKINIRNVRARNARLRI